MGIIESFLRLRLLRTVIRSIRLVVFMRPFSIAAGWPACCLLLPYKRGQIVGFLRNLFQARLLLDGLAAEHLIQNAVECAAILGFVI